MGDDNSLVRGFAGGALAALLLRQKPTSQPLPELPPVLDPDSISRIEFLGQEAVQFESPPSNPSPIPFDILNSTHAPVNAPPGATHVLAMVVDQAPLTTMQILCISNGAPFLPVSGQLVPQLKWMITGFAPLTGGETVVTGVLSWFRVREG